MPYSRNLPEPHEFTVVDPTRARGLGRRVSLPDSTVLPESVRAALKEAALVDPETPIGESHVRSSALDFVIKRARLKHREFFV